MKRIICIFLMLIMIFPICVVNAEDINAQEETVSVEGDTEQVVDLQATEVRVTLDTDMVMAYQCPVRQRYVQVTFAATAGPEPILVGIKYLDTEQNHWVPLPDQTQSLNKNQTATFRLPVDAKYKVYVQKAGGNYGMVTLSISASPSSTS